MNPWTRDVLGDLACALYSCGLEPIPCAEGKTKGLAAELPHVAGVTLLVTL